MEARTGQGGGRNNRVSGEAKKNVQKGGKQLCNEEIRQSPMEGTRALKGDIGTTSIRTEKSENGKLQAPSPGKRKSTVGIYRKTKRHYKKK